MPITLYSYLSYTLQGVFDNDNCTKSMLYDIKRDDSRDLFLKAKFSKIRNPCECPHCLGFGGYAPLGIKLIKFQLCRRVARGTNVQLSDNYTTSQWY